MNGILGHGGGAALWQEARNSDGRIYYYNTITKATQWTKPEEMMTAAERALSSQPWKEYTAEGGRKYWYNTETKQSSWEIPEVYKEALAREQPATPLAAPAPTFVAGGGFQASHFEQPREREPLGDSRQIAYGNDVNGSRTQAFTPASNDPDYATFEEAEAAYLKMLRRCGVQPEWTWEQTMRAIIKDPQYRSLKDPKDRKAAFEKFAVEVRLQEKDRAKERMAKLRSDFGTMLKSHPEIKHYTRWKTAKLIIEGETIYRSAKDDDERRQLFEDYIIDLKRAHVEKEAVTRKAATDELLGIMSGLDLEPYTRWSEAQGMIQANSRFRGDEKFKSLTKFDVLTVFESHIKSLERTFNDVRQEQKNQKARIERQNRDAFLDLLQELKTNGKIKAGSKWSTIYPLLESSEKYTAMLGQSGSSPLDLFRDVVEEEERALRGTRNDVLDVLDDKRYEIQQKTTFEEFLSLMHNDRRTANIDRDHLSLIFERLREKVSRRTEDDRHLAERHQRRAIDGLRSYIKHLEPPVRFDDTFEKIRPRIERSEEYLALPSDELRRSAFDKHIRRLRDKEEEMERERLRRRDRASMERSSHRDRDRGERSHRSSGRHARPSRSPEPDIYEADRRKAIADREKNYRKTSAADSLLSPGRRGSDRSERERDSDRAHRSRHESSYDRDRRDREDEREKQYRKRADPRRSVDELPYGDERPAKRSRRERTPRERSPAPPRDRRPRTRTPPPAALPPPKEDSGVHSGSEEGEIEEE